MHWKELHPKVRGVLLAVYKQNFENEKGYIATQENGSRVARLNKLGLISVLTETEDKKGPASWWVTEAGVELVKSRPSDK